MRIIAKASPIIAFIKEKGSKPININKIEKRLNELLIKKSWEELIKLTDQIQNPEIKGLDLSFECNKQEFTEVPNFITARLLWQEKQNN